MQSAHPVKEVYKARTVCRIHYTLIKYNTCNKYGSTYKYIWTQIYHSCSETERYFSANIIPSRKLYITRS